MSNFKKYMYQEKCCMIVFLHLTHLLRELRYLSDPAIYFCNIEATKISLRGTKFYKNAINSFFIENICLFSVNRISLLSLGKTMSESKITWLTFFPLGVWKFMGEILRMHLYFDSRANWWIIVLVPGHEMKLFTYQSRKNIWIWKSIYFDKDIIDLTYANKSILQLLRHIKSKLNNFNLLIKVKGTTWFQVLMCLVRQMW